MFRVVPPPIIRHAYNCIYSICYLSHRYCYLRYVLQKKSSSDYSSIYPKTCNFTQFILSGNFSTCFGWYLHPSSGAQTALSIASGISHAVTVICRYSGRVETGLSVLWVAYAYASDDGWKYHPKHVEQFTDINKLCNVASFWIYIGIYLQFTYP